MPAALLETIAIINAFSSPSIISAGILLEAIEVGNEADLFSMNGGRLRTYTVRQYVSEWVLISLSTMSVLYPHAAAFLDGTSSLA